MVRAAAYSAIGGDGYPHPSYATAHYSSGGSKWLKAWIWLLNLSFLAFGIAFIVWWRAPSKYDFKAFAISWTAVIAVLLFCVLVTMAVVYHGIVGIGIRVLVWSGAYLVAVILAYGIITQQLWVLEPKQDAILNDCDGLGGGSCKAYVDFEIMTAGGAFISGTVVFFGALLLLHLQDSDMGTYYVTDISTLQRITIWSGEVKGGGGGAIYSANGEGREKGGLA